MNDFNQQLALVGAATSYSDVYQLPAEVGHVEASAVVSAIAGTSPTLIVTLQTSQDKVTWEDRNILPTLSATGTRKVRLGDPRLYFRFKLVLAGTTPTATVNLFAIGREGEGDASEMLSMQNAAVATGNGTSIDVVGQAGVVVAVTGTFVGTITFEGSLDDTNWFSVFAVKLGDGAIGSTATAPGLYRISCAALTSVRARVSAWTSGSITAKGRSTQNDSGAYDALFARMIERFGGEDINRNLTLTEEASNSARITTATTTLCLGAPGTMYGVYVEVALTGTATYYDALTATGSPILVLPIGTPQGWHRFPKKLTVGLTCVTSAADRLVPFANV